MDGKKYKEHQIETLQSAYERLKNENDLKNGWISLISHNFKGTFSNLIQLIEAQENGSISEADFFKLLPQIKQDAANNLQLIADTSIWTKTQRDDYHPDMTEVYVVELFARLKKDFQEILTRKQLRFIYSGDETIQIYADRFLISYVLEKIVHNAFKYSRPGQSVLMTAEEDLEETILSISDQGTGMDENQIKSIFTFDSPVYRGTEGETGVGLSLKIAKNFVHLLGGKIGFESLKGERTTVEIILPRENRKLNAGGRTHTGS